MAKQSGSPAATAAAGPASKAAKPKAARPGAARASAAADYPGKKFGLREEGSGSVASMGRRLLALCIDWALSLVIADGLLHNAYWALAIFAVEVYILTAITGTTVGKRIAGIRVMRTSGGPAGFGWAAVRTLLLLTVIPPLLSDRDLRGLHDRASDTIVVRI